LILNHLSQVHGARAVRIVVEKDVGDATGGAPSGSAKAGSDAYYTKANPIPEQIKR